MARGPKKHLKLLNAPSHWLLHKMGGVYAPRPSTGPHKLRECLPVMLILRNRLKYALTRRECVAISMKRLIEIDGKIRTDIYYPTGFQDVIRIDKANEIFRLLYDTKGRITLNRIEAKEATWKLCRVVKIARANKASIGNNPFLKGILSSIPYIVTHDGRTIRYPDPDIRVNDTIKFDFKTGKILEFVKFDIGNIAMIVKGANTGRVGLVMRREKHPGSHEIVHLRDSRGRDFATRVANVFIIGKGNKPMINLPADKGLKYTVVEEKAAKKTKTKTGKTKSKSKSKSKSAKPTKKSKASKK